MTFVRYYKIGKEVAIMDFLDKLNYMLEKNGLNKSTLSKSCGIPYTTIDGWYKRGYEGLKINTLSKLSNFFNTTLDFWIKEDLSVDSADEDRLIKRYRKLDNYGKEWIHICVDRELDRITSYGEHKSSPPVITLPYYQKLSGTGTRQIIWDDIPSVNFDAPCSAETKAADFAMSVNGDSMEPLYWDSDTILVRKTSNLEIGDIGVFLLGGDCYVKQLGDKKLISINPSYTPIEIKDTSDFMCLGKVIGNLTEHSPSEITYKYKREELRREYQAMYPMAAAKGMNDSEESRNFMKKLMDESDKLFQLGKKDLDS